MNGKLYTTKKYCPKTIKKLRKKLDRCDQVGLPPLDPAAGGTVLEPPLLPGYIYWAVTSDRTLYGLFCVDLVISPDGRKVIETVLGFWEGPRAENDRAVLEFIARNYKEQTESEDLAILERRMA